MANKTPHKKCEEFYLILCQCNFCIQIDILYSM